MPNQANFANIPFEFRLNSLNHAINQRCLHPRGGVFAMDLIGIDDGGSGLYAFKTYEYEK
jgi:hypothetical protein